MNTDVISKEVMMGTDKLYIVGHFDTKLFYTSYFGITTFTSTIYAYYIISMKLSQRYKAFISKYRVIFGSSKLVAYI